MRERRESPYSPASGWLRLNNAQPPFPTKQKGEAKPSLNSPEDAVDGQKGEVGASGGPIAWPFVKKQQEMVSPTIAYSKIKPWIEMTVWLIFSSLMSKASIHYRTRKSCCQITALVIWQCNRWRLFGKGTQSKTQP